MYEGGFSRDDRTFWGPLSDSVPFTVIAFHEEIKFSAAERALQKDFKLFMN